MNVIYEISFDLDGVLAHTRAAVWKAYQIAGVDMPPAAWGEPMENWLPKIVGKRAAEIHAKKQEVYKDCLEHAHVLAGYGVAQRLLDEGHVVFVTTHASQKSAEDVVQWLGLDVPVFSVTEKAKFLRGANADVHIDDNPFSSSFVPIVEFINHEDTLYRKIMEVLSSTQSS